MLSICGAQTTHDVGYSNGIVTASLVAAYSANPGLTRTAPPFSGDSYGTIIQDSVDWLMTSQEDSGVGQRGGWRYTFDAGADTSADSWSYVGLEGSEQVLGLVVLEDVKKQAELRIHDSQAPSGQFGYTGTGASALAVTRRPAAGCPASSLSPLEAATSSSSMCLHRTVPSQRGRAQDRGGQPTRGAVAR